MFSLFLQLQKINYQNIFLTSQKLLSQLSAANRVIQIRAICHIRPELSTFQTRSDHSINLIISKLKSFKYYIFTGFIEKSSHFYTFDSIISILIPIGF